MQIGIDIRELEPGKRTGIGRFLVNLLSASALRRSRHAWILFGNQRTEPPDGFPMIRISESSRLLWDQLLLPSALARQRIDLFFSPYRKAPLWLPCPSVVTIHDLLPFTLTATSSAQSRLFWMLMRRMARHAMRIMTVSEFVKRDIVHHLGVPPEKVTVIYHGLHPSFCPVVPEQARAQLAERLGITGDYILFVGQLNPHKNIDKLIAAYAALPDSMRQRYQVLIAGGGGSTRQALEALIIRQKLGRSVRLLGVVEDELLPPLYSMASVCVLPSEHEGFGLPVIEAMACACVVIAARRAALPEIVGEAGLLVDPAEPRSLTGALEQALTDGALRQTLRARGLARAKQFSLDQTVSRFLQLFDALEAQL